MKGLFQFFQKLIHMGLGAKPLLRIHFHSDQFQKIFVLVHDMIDIAILVDPQKISKIDFKLVVIALPFLIHKMLKIFDINIYEYAGAVIQIPVRIQNPQTVMHIFFVIGHSHNYVSKKAFFQERNRFLHPFLFRIPLFDLCIFFIQLLPDFGKSLLKLIHIRGFEQVVPRPVLDSLHSQVKFLITADQNNLTGQFILIHILCHLKAGDIVHFDVRENHVRHHILQVFNDLLSIGKKFRHFKAEPVPVHNIFQALTDPSFIICNHKLIHITSPRFRVFLCIGSPYQSGAAGSEGCSLGKRIVTLVPMPSLLSMISPYSFP